MLRLIAAALVLASVASPAFAFFQGPWNAAAQHGTLGGYAKASTSRSCLTGDTRAVLNRLEARVGAVQIVSTCRPGARIAGTNRQSKHAIGRAVDFNTRRKGEAIAFLRSQGVFVMTYSTHQHIHFNTGQRGAAFNANGYGRSVSARKMWRR
jgi:hypothetical protein